MATANPQRADLYARLEEILGRPYADTLMTYLPEQPSSTIATKDDIADLASRIDQLGERMDRRFEQVDARFEQIDARFEQVDARFEQIDARFEQVDARFAQMERQFERVDHRFEQMENRFHIVRDDLRDQMKTYTLTVVGSMTALTAIYAGLLAIIA
jgi:uncharacterized protein (DUF3084 family)